MPPDRRVAALSVAALSAIGLAALAAPAPSIPPQSHPGLLPRPAEPGSSIPPQSHPGLLPRPAEPGSSIPPQSHPGLLPRPAEPGSSIPVNLAEPAQVARLDALTRQLGDELAAIDRALAAIGDKLTAADDARHRRLRAAIRALRAAPGDDAMTMARRRAAARLLLDRDTSEHALLADEASQLRSARAGIASDAAQLPTIGWPTELARPAPGKIARHFGTLTHERSQVTLSRRGIDLEVEDHVTVTAPAAGTVRYAGPIRGLDQGVIIDHGTFLTVVAKLGDVTLPIGAPIGVGDRVGRAARHRVYLEVRLKLGPGGAPIDPEPLLAAEPARSRAKPVKPRRPPSAEPPGPAATSSP